MKTDTLLILAAAGAGLYFMSRTLKTTVSGSVGNSMVPRPGGTSSSLNNGGNLPGVITEIANDDLPGQAGYGWRYFSDGTVIGPDGSYYSNGVKVWSPA